VAHGGDWPARPVTIVLDEKFAAAGHAVAERTGVPTEELYERALREVLARDFAELTEEIAVGQRRLGVSVSDDAACRWPTRPPAASPSAPWPPPDRTSAWELPRELPWELRDPGAVETVRHRSDVSPAHRTSSWH
jgi:hypothetical protein